MMSENSMLATTGPSEFSYISDEEDCPWFGYDDFTCVINQDRHLETNSNMPQ